MLRDAYFAKLGRAVQLRSFSACEWVVAEAAGAIAACMSYQDSPDTRQRWAYDFYCLSNRTGMRALRALANWFRDDSAKAGLEIFFYSDPVNEEWNEALGRDGDFQLVGLLWYRSA